MAAQAGKGQVRFGPFELDLSTGELRKHGVRVRLQAKPFEILRALLEQPGAVVGRDELRRRLWNDGTFVDFENGLNTAMNRLRLVLGDSADHPRYVETVARSGYRFLAPVSVAKTTASMEAGAPMDLTAPSAPLNAIQRVPEVQATLGRRLLRPSLILAGLALASVAGFLYARLPSAPEPKARQLTFRRGQIWSAHFGPDGKSVLYTSQSTGEPRRLYQTNPVSPESRALGFEDMTVSAVSRNGELALLRFGGTMNITGGTLLRAPLNGGAPAEADRNIFDADWAADGSALAIVRAAPGAHQIEYPSGKVLYRTPGWISGLRTSPDGRSLAFFHHPTRHEFAGSLILLTLATGETRELSTGWTSASGVAWHPRTGEIWFTAARKGGARSLWAVSAQGKLRPVALSLGILTLRDISPEGRILVTRDERRLEMAGSLRGEPERSLTWLDWSRVQEVSPDGGIVLFDESGEGAGDSAVVYVHRAADGSTVRLGQGRAMGFTPDVSKVLVLASWDRSELRLLPLNGGPPESMPKTNLDYQWARFLPDGNHLLALAADRTTKPPGGLRLWVHPWKGGKPFPISSEMMIRNAAISPDGTSVAVLTPQPALVLFSTGGSAPPRTLTSEEPLAPLRWSADGEWLYVQHLQSYTGLPAKVSRIHGKSGARELWKEISPPDTMGVTDVTGVAISRDGGSYAYSYRRTLSDLYAVDGW
ncbi:MAG: winged helix-turn-helix domain-containing protein [Bryobacterales bacterium]|nr:winged helix-turn-helix domain-containing protein [Bryobacterales bacterium]